MNDRIYLFIYVLESSLKYEIFVINIIQYSFVYLFLKIIALHSWGNGVVYLKFYELCLR